MASPQGMGNVWSFGSVGRSRSKGTGPLVGPTRPSPSFQQHQQPHHSSPPPYTPLPTLAATADKVAPRSSPGHDTTSHHSPVIGSGLIDPRILDRSSAVDSSMQSSYGYGSFAGSGRESGHQARVLDTVSTGMDVDDAQSVSQNPHSQLQSTSEGLLTPPAGQQATQVRQRLPMHHAC